MVTVQPTASTGQPPSGEPPSGEPPSDQPPSAQPSPTPGGSTAAAEGTCSAGQLALSLDSWEGAAGARIATITGTNVGETDCILEGPPGPSLLDGTHSVLIGSAGVVGGAPDISLQPGQLAHLLVSAQNWCAPPPRPPVSIGLTMPDGSVLIAEPAAGVDFEPPPCNGPGQPARIEVSPESWSLQS